MVFNTTFNNISVILWWYMGKEENQLVVIPLETGMVVCVLDLIFHIQNDLSAKVFNFLFVVLYSY
jgi:hypothetical protein